MARRVDPERDQWSIDVKEQQRTARGTGHRCTIAVTV
jgi:hypothetical protein